MSSRPGRNETWSRWNDNREPARDTPRREQQKREWDDNRERRELELETT